MIHDYRMRLFIFLPHLYLYISRVIDRYYEPSA